MNMASVAPPPAQLSVPTFALIYIGIHRLPGHHLFKHGSAAVHQC